MQVSVEKVSNVERRLTIIVPANQVEEAYDRHIQSFAKNANIKGFRPGKAPINFIKQRFGEDARKEAISEVMKNALFEAIKEHHLQPINMPQITPKIITADQPLEFVASFEILPEIGEIKCNIDHIEKLNVDITAEDVQHVILQLQKQYGTWTEVDRSAKEKDRVVIDYYSVFAGEADTQNKVQNFPLELGSKRMIPGFEEGLLGVKANEEKTLHLSFPENYGQTERAGKPVDFVVQVKQVFEANIPSLDEEFVKKLGIKSGSTEELTNQIKESLEHERNRLVKEKMKEQIFTHLLEQNPIEVPHSLVDREAKNIHDEIYPAHHPHNHHQHSDDELTAFHDIAKKRITLSLLLSDYAKQADFKVDQDRVAARIQEIASVYENPTEVIALLSSEERRRGIEMQVIEDQVIDKFIEKTKIVEKTVSYAELKGIQL